MAVIEATPAVAGSVPPALPAHLRRLYRAFVTPQRATDPERTFFVEAATHQAAGKKIAGVISTLEYTKLCDAEQAIYNVHSIDELIHEGLSEDIEARAFETGWSHDQGISWVEAPVFLVADPAPLLRAWARIAGGSQP